MMRVLVLALLAAAAAALTVRSETITLGTEMQFDDESPRVVCEPLTCQSLYITKVTCGPRSSCVTDSPWPDSVVSYRVKCNPRFPLHCGVRITTVPENDHRDFLLRVELSAVGLVVACAIGSVLVVVLCVRKIKSK